MKKVILGLFALTAFVNVNAQKNTLLVGGNVAYSTNKTGVGSTVRVNSFELSPTIGYQFTDHMTVGIKSSIISGEEKTETTLLGISTSTKDKVDEFKIGGFLRYAQALGDSGLFSIYGDLGGGYQGLKNKTNGTTTTEAEGFYVDFTPALFINMKHGFGLNFSIGGIGYNQYISKSGYADTKSTNFDVRFGKEVSVGISKNFGL